MLTSNQRGLGHEPVTVLGSRRSFVTVKAIDPPLATTSVFRLEYLDTLG
jgi:hypothetical protein